MTPTLKKSLEETGTGKLGKLVGKNSSFYKGKGCDRCNNSGYFGRICINEVLVADETIREAILRKASAGEIKILAQKRGMTTMQEDGLRKALAGETTIEEILRVIHD